MQLDKLFFPDILTQNGAVSPNDDPINYRLPTNVKPNSYDIMLVPYLKEGKFTGIEKIEVTVIQETDTITLHVGNIEIKVVTVAVLPDKKLINDTIISKDYVTEKYNIIVPNVLTKDTRLQISFTYNGILSDNMIGFYRSSYIENGETK
jgi:aminopeptidase 2